MAIFHFSAQVASRSAGKSAVAMSAYRSGEEIKDERTGEKKFYPRQVAPETIILAPKHAPEWVYDRSRLWNEVEKAEKRVDAQLCREINIALPKEFDNELQTRVVTDYIQSNFVDRGMVADIAIHRDDTENPHFHVMLTMREITSEGFGKKDRSWNEKRLVEEWREKWSEAANRYLAPDAQIDHRSHEARELEVLPTVHEGHIVRSMEERGITTNLGNVNREIKEYNTNVIDLQKARAERAEKNNWKHFSEEEKVKVKAAVKVCNGFVDLDSVGKKLTYLQKQEGQVEKDIGYIKWKEDTFGTAKKLLNDIKGTNYAIMRSQSDLKSINWLNPLKYKENKATKENSERDIQYHEKQKAIQDKRLEYHKEKLGFSNENEFYMKWEAFQQEKEDRYSKLQGVKNRVNEERRIVNGAKEALENAEVRRIAEKFPDWQNAKYLTYDQAKRLDKLSQGQTTPDQVEKQYQKLFAESNKISESIGNLESEGTRLKQATESLDILERVNHALQRQEKSVGRFQRFVSKEAKEKFKDTLEVKERNEQMLKQLGVKDREDLYKQTLNYHKDASQELPKLKNNRINIDEKLAIQNSILTIMRQVEMRRQLEEQRVRNKHHEKSHEKGRSR